MSSLNSLIAVPFASPAPAAPSATASLTATPHTPETGGVHSLISTPFAATPQATPHPLGYFEGTEPSGTFVGIGTSSDPYSGRPYLAYTLPGANATTTDYTRTASKNNPEVAAPTDKISFENPRMPESASQAIRKQQGATGDEQLDHRMALAVGGSNNGANLKLVPTKENQAASKLEGKLPDKIASGALSLFDAQKQEAQAKGLPLPFTDEQPAQQGSLWDKLVGGTKNALGAAATVAAKAGSEAIDLGKEGYTAWDGFLRQAVLTPYLTAVTEAGNASAHVTENISNPDGTMKPINKIDWGQATANELKLVSAGLGAVASPGMTPYQVANATPVVGHVLDPVNWLFSGAGKVGGAADTLVAPIINKLPISQEDKKDLNEAISGLGSTLAQFAVGAYVFGRIGKAVEMKANAETPNVVANLRDLSLKDVKDVVESTKRFASAVQERLPQNLSEAQRGFAKLPGIDEKAPEEPLVESNTQEEKKNESTVPTIPPELEPLAETARKFKTPEEFIASTKEVAPLNEKGEPMTPQDLKEFHAKATEPVKVEVPPMTRALERMSNSFKPTSALTDLAREQKSPADFYRALMPQEQAKVREIIDPNHLTHTNEEAAHAFYSRVKENIEPRDTELPPTASQTLPTNPTDQTEGLRHITRQRLKPELNTQPKTTPPPQRENPKETSYNKNTNANKVGPTEPESIITEHNGGVNPPENKGGMVPPEIDWTKGKDIAAIRQSTDTLERTLEKVFPKAEADTLNEFLTEANRRNEANRVDFQTKLRNETKAEVVDKLGIKPATAKSAWVQRYGEGRVSLDELKKELPHDWQNVTKASDFFRKKYDNLIDRWNKERVRAGLKPINKRPNYFRHFMDLSGFAHMYGLNFRQEALPTAISGMTEFFRSQSPWTNAAMRRLGNTTTDDAVGGFDNYLDTVTRAIYHTDTVQRGRLVDKYLRQAADGNAVRAQEIRDSGADKETPPPIELPRLASTLKQWTDTVSGKQNIFDRSLEAMVGRPALAVMRTITRQFGLNVIAGNVSAAITHAIPSVYTLATVDKGAAFHGLYGTLTSPFLEDFRKIDGVRSDFLARRFGKEEIQKTAGESVATALSSPFHLVDQFMSRFAVESKYHEGVAKGLEPLAAMKEADNYASRVIGDRSAGNLPPIMSTKTLGWMTQFQIEVNDNLRVLMHDIPRWEEGSVPKIANRLVQFAVFSFLFNQTMQYIKGSGKGLDPIDMGLTLAGLNDEGHDQSLMNRLGLVGTDLSKELPFISVLSGGQIPAFEPLKQAVADALAGSELKALQGVMASFASPVGGGQQLQKSLTAIQAWRQGYVTDSRGNITATVPQTLPTLVQGVAFGKSSFENVKKSKTEIGNLDQTLKEQQAASSLKNTQADNIWKQLKSLPKEEAKAQLQQIATEDPDMAKRVLKSAQDDALGMTKQDTLLKALPTDARAQYIADKLKDLSTTEEKKAYLLDLATKKILTEPVLTALAPLMKK